MATSGKKKKSAAKPAVHSTTLRWEAPPEAHKPMPDVSYHVYRSLASHGTDNQIECGNDFKQIATVHAPLTEYTDTTVVGGQVYCYRVTTVRAGKESAPSAVRVANIPADERH